MTNKELDVNNNSMVRDVWRRKDLGKFGNTFTTIVAPHGVTLIEIK